MGSWHAIGYLSLHSGPIDCWNKEVAEASMPSKNILIFNRRLNVGIGLGDLGKRARSGDSGGARWIVYYNRGF